MSNLDFDLSERAKERQKLIGQAQELLRRASSQPGGITSEDRQQFDRMINEATNIDQEISSEKQKRQMQDILDSQSMNDPALPSLGESRTRQTEDQRREEMEIRGAELFLRHGKSHPMTKEFRVLQQGIDTLGGYLVLPSKMSSDWIKFADDDLIFRRLADRETLTMAASLGVPELKSDPDDSDWTSEIGTGNEDTAMSFGAREFKPHPLAKRLKVTETLIRNSARPVTPLIRERLTYKTNVAEEKAFMTGDGNGKPLGVFVDSPDGISSARDQQEPAPSSVSYDNLVRAKYKLKTNYWSRAVWVFHREIFLEIALLVDGNNQPLLRPGRGLLDGDADQLLGMPVVLSEFAPNSLASDAYYGILGDFRTGYKIVDSENIRIKVVDQLYSESDQIGYFIRKEVDGGVKLEEPWVRLQAGT